MNLSELTDKLYAEGVEKGNQEAQVIISKANDEAAAIIAQAQKDAEAVMAQAQAKSKELDTNTRSELKLYAQQSISAIKTEITNIVTDKIVRDSVENATKDAKFMQTIIAKMAEQMVKEGNVVIEAKDAEALKKYFAANAKSLLDKGVEIKEVKGIKTAFTIAPANGGYKLNFGDEEFVAYFKEFLRPQLIDLLF